MITYIYFITEMNTLNSKRKAASLRSQERVRRAAPAGSVAVVWLLLLSGFGGLLVGRLARAELLLQVIRWQDLQGLQHYFVRVLHNEAPLRTMIRNMVRRTALQQLHTQRLRNQLPDLFGCLFWQQNLNHNAAANCLCYTISQLRIPLQKKH